jgi:hypothetical protein
VFSAILFKKRKQTWLSSPSKIIIRKKTADHRGAAGIWETAPGYAMKANPGPAETIDSVHIN